MKQPRLIFIFITVVLDVIGIGIMIPSLPEVIRRFSDSQQDMTHLYGYFISIFSVMQFLASPLLGVISDIYGRRSILLTSLFVSALDYIVMAISPNLTVLFISRMITGLTSASMTVAMAYITDISKLEDRSKNYGLIGAGFGLGFILGPAIGGLLGKYNPLLPFYAAALMNFLNFLFGLFILPESLPPEKRSKFEWSKINPMKSLFKIFSLPGLFTLLVVYFLFQLAGQTHPSIWTLYTQARFGWGVTEVGTSLAFVGLLSAISQGYLTRILIPKWGELNTVLWSLIGFTVAFVLYGLAYEGWMVYAILFTSSIFWISGPALSSIISKRVESTEQGELQGSLVSLMSLASIISPIVTTQLFGYFTSDNFEPKIYGAPYFFAAVVSFICLILFYKLHRTA